MNKEELNNSETVEEVNNTTEEITAEQVVEEATPEVVEEIKTEEITETADEVVTEEVAPQNISTETKEGYEFIPSKKKGNKGPFIVVSLVIIALFAIVYFAYTNLSNPKKMFIKSINKAYDKVENFIDDNMKQNNINKAMLVTEDLSVNIKMDDSLIDANTKGIIEEINKIKLETQVGYDQKNKEMLMNVGALYNNKSLIGLGAYAKDENMYFELKDLFDKYIEVPMEDYDTYFEQSSIDVDDIKYVLSKTKDSFINNLDENNFKKSKATIKVEGKNVRTTKVTYALSEEKAMKLSKKAFNELVKDSKYIEALATISGTDKEEIKESLEETIDELTEEIESGDLEKEDVISFVVYTKGFMGNIAGYEIVIEDIESEETGNISYYIGKSKDEFKVVGADEELMNATISDNKFVFEVPSEEDTVKLEVLKKEKGKKTTYSYTLTASGMSINGDVVVEMVKEDKDGSYEANISVSASLMGMVEVKLSGKSKSEYVDELKLPSVTNSIEVNELTETDMNTIQTKLMKNEAFVSLVSKISAYTNTSNSVSEY